MNAETNTQRDELAEVIRGIDGPATLGGLEVADAILAAGYRKPRTLTTVEELDALPATTIIRASNGEVFQRDTDGPYYDGPHDWQSFEGTFWNGETFVFPATVLYAPEAAE